MRKGLEYKKPGAEERERAHQFGQPEGNKQHIIDGKNAVNQREFYKWVESVATDDELEAYIADKTNPGNRIRFVEANMAAKDMKDFFELTNQTHGQPKQQIEVQAMPDINCNIFGEED